MFAKIASRKNSIFLLLVVTILTQQVPLTAVPWFRTLSAVPTGLTAVQQPSQLTGCLCPAQAPADWTLWKKFVNFLGTPYDAQQAQDMLTIALRDNGTAFKLATIFSGVFLLAGGASYLYKKHLQKQPLAHIEAEKQLTRENIKMAEQLSNVFFIGAAGTVLATLFSQSWYIGKLKEIAIRG